MTLRSATLIYGSMPRPTGNCSNGVDYPYCFQSAGQIPLFGLEAMLPSGRTEKDDLGGVVLRPEPFDAGGVNCGWSYDANTVPRRCDAPGRSSRCVPGCPPQITERSDAQLGAFRQEYTPSRPHALTPSRYTLTPSRPHATLTPPCLHALTPSHAHALTRSRLMAGGPHPHAHGLRAPLRLQPSHV